MKREISQSEHQLCWPPSASFACLARTSDRRSIVIVASRVELVHLCRLIVTHDARPRGDGGDGGREDVQTVDAGFMEASR
jgi:hypothetical protein